MTKGGVPGLPCKTYASAPWGKGHKWRHMFFFGRWPLVSKMQGLARGGYETCRIHRLRTRTASHQRRRRPIRRRLRRVVNEVNIEDIGMISISNEDARGAYDLRACDLISARNLEDIDMISVSSQDAAS